MILQRLTQNIFSEECGLQLATKDQIAALLANQELSLCERPIEKFFSSIIQTDEKFTTEYQKYLCDSLSVVKSTLNGVLELRSVDLNWRKVNDLIDENVALKEKIIDGASVLEFKINAYLKNLLDYLESSKNHFQVIVSGRDKEQYEFFKIWFGVKSMALLLKTKDSRILLIHLAFRDMAKNLALIFAHKFHFRLMLAKLNESTFTSYTIKSLNEIRNRRKCEISNLNGRIAEVKSRLKSYATLSGSTFDDLIDSYGKLTKDIEDKRWALREFSLSNDRSKVIGFDHEANSMH
uniref:Uncharacterized protein n=1 Tax=Romanomermis culicivorax TaxID=13658 RepID=A0A915ID84_ROMCU